MLLLFPMSVFLLVFAVAQIVKTGGDWQDWSMLVVGALGVATMAVGETWRSRERRRQHEQLRAEWREMARWASDRQRGGR